MAKVRGPLLSNTASGNIGKTIIYSNSKGVSTVKGNRLEKITEYHFRTKPAISQTVAQIAVRDNFRKIIEEWNGLTTEQKEVYEEKAKGLPVTAISMYLKQKIKEYYDLEEYKKFWLFGIGQKINLFMFKSKYEIGLLLSTVRIN